MANVAITFPTTHDMLRAEALLCKFVYCQNIPAPPDSKSICTSALLIDKSELKKARLLMEKEKINWEEIKSKPGLYDKFVSNSFETHNNTNKKNSNLLLDIYNNAGMLDENNLNLIFSLEREQREYLKKLFSQKITLAYSWLVPMGYCSKNCDRCLLPRKKMVDFSTLDWLFDEFEGGFNHPVAFVYGEKFDEKILEYLLGNLSKLTDKPSFLYLGNNPLSLPMKLISMGSSIPCDEHVLKMKTEDIIKEIIFIKENTNHVLASQSLIPIHIDYESLKEDEKLKLEKSIITLRLALGDSPIIGGPEMNNGEIKTRGESLRFRWL